MAGIPSQIYYLDAEKNLDGNPTESTECLVMNSSNPNDEDIVFPPPKCVSDEGKEDFIRVVSQKEEEKNPRTRNRFWNVGPERSVVMTATRSTCVLFEPDTSRTFTTKTMIDVLSGGIKISYPARPPSTAIVEKRFSRKDGLVLTEASKQRPITITQDVGLDTVCIPRPEFPESGELKLPSAEVLCALPRKTISTVRIGWMRPEFAVEAEVVEAGTSKGEEVSKAEKQK